MNRIQQFHAALMDAFTIDSMQRMLSFEMGQDLESIVSGGNKQAQFFDLIKWSAENNKLNDLAYAAYRTVPNNEKINEFFRQYGEIEFAPNQSIMSNPYVIDDPNQTIRDRLREVEIFLFGPKGSNGIRSQLKEVREDTSEIKETLNKILVQQNKAEEHRARIENRLSKLESPGPNSSIIWRIILAFLLILVSLAAFITIAAQFGIINAG